MSTFFLEVGSSSVYYLSFLSKDLYNMCSFKSNKCAKYAFIKDKLLVFLLTSMSRPHLATKYLKMIKSRFSASNNLKGGNKVCSCKGNVATSISIDAC